MNLKPIARWTGAAYLSLAVTGAMSFLVIRSQLYVAGDPTATLANLTEKPVLAQFGVFAEVLVVLAQALAALGFFTLFHRDRPAAAFGVAGFGLANALAVLGSAAFLTTALAVATDPTLAPGGDVAATVGLLYTLSGASWAVGNIFFGLWLVPMGWFAISTGRMPRVLGWALVVGGVAYVVSALLAVAGPSFTGWVNVLALAATVGELWIIGYLFVRGIRPAVLSSTTVSV